MTNSPKRRKLEDLVVELGLAETLAKSRALIMAGEVVVNDQRVDKPGHLVLVGAQVRLKRESARYVGRGGEKLAGAFEDFGVTDTLADSVVLDVGSSTGGFTDACLQAGARKVYALDVGTNQLAWSLRQDHRVVVLEKLDIRQLSPLEIEPPDWVVVDVSFISLKPLLSSLLQFGHGRTCRYLLLVKPQFELARHDVPEGGVVKSDVDRTQAVNSVREGLRSLGIHDVTAHDCRIPGREGNREVFLYFCTGVDPRD